MDKKLSRREQLTEAQLVMIQITGKISGKVKDILMCQDKNEMMDNIEYINKALKQLIQQIYDISDALNLDFNKIIEVKNGDDV